MSDRTTAAVRAERKRLVRIAEEHGAEVAMASIGYCNMFKHLHVCPTEVTGRPDHDWICSDLRCDKNAAKWCGKADCSVKTGAHEHRFVTDEHGAVHPCRCGAPVVLKNLWFPGR